MNTEEGELFLMSNINDLLIDAVDLSTCTHCRSYVYALHVTQSSA